MATTLQDLNISGLKFYEPPSNANTPKVMDGTSTSELQSNFLKLLTVQLQNQDPMNPVESAEMTSQLAQLNMVDGINTMNKTMSSLVEMMRGADFVNYSNTVGRSALVSGNEMFFDGQNPIAFALQFAQPMPKASLQITDASGNIVKTMDLGAVQTELMNMYWDGLGADGQALAAGKYRIVAKGVDGTKEVAPEAFVSSIGAAVGRSGHDINLTLADGKKILPKDVVQWVIQ
jgi:flagellar basal-body rod modification protein FlgD